MKHLKTITMTARMKDFTRIVRTTITTFLVLLLLFSCKKDDTIILTPSLTFKCGEGYVCNDTSLINNTHFTFGIITSTSSEKKYNITVKKEIIGGTTEIILDTMVLNLDMTWTLKTSPTIGVEIIYCSIEEFNLQTNFAIQTEPTPINYYSNIFLTSHHVIDWYHFFSISNNDRYTITDCEAYDVQILIDLIYFNIDENAHLGHTLSSPDLDVNSQYSLNWSHKNKTLFSVPVDDVQFDDIENENQLFNVINYATIDQHYVDELKLDDVIAFEIENGKRGLIKIIYVTPDYSYVSEIAFDVKVEI